MGREKEKQIEGQENWHRYAKENGKRCAFCDNVLTYEEYTDLGRRRLACVNQTSLRN